MLTSEDDVHSENEDSKIELKGFLSKWVNYIYGWQSRFIVLKDSTLSYYKSEEDSDFGCRGALNLERATIREHEIDEFRFDISVENENGISVVWYLRAENVEDKRNWIEVLKSFRIEDDTQLKRHGSTMSIQSNTLSTTSGSSLQQTSRNLREKLHEIETYRDILYNQINSLQKFFDACAVQSTSFQEALEDESGLKTLDFKGEAITFRETTSGVLTTLNHCLEIILLKEESIKRKLDHEIEKRKKVEEELKACQDKMVKMKMTSSGPDLEEEGPNSTIPEDEFFDAVETGLEKIEEIRQIRVKLKLQNQQSQIEAGQIAEEEETTEVDAFGTGNLAKYHQLWPEIDRVVEEQLNHSLKGVSEGGWQIFADEGEMKMYRREEEIDGMVVDPLKSVHVVVGCTAREMCHYFFDPKYRNDWETTLEECQILETISPDTLVLLQTHKRIWPANQRDALFWTHMRKIENSIDSDAHDAWLVCNQSTLNPCYPAANQGKCIRIYLTVILLCQTFIKPTRNGERTSLSRNDLTCKITYCSVVNPGGWVKPSLLRAVYKKEYPKFLKRFTGYVLEQSKNKPIKF